MINAALQIRRRRAAEAEQQEADAFFESDGRAEDLAVRRWVALLPERQRLAVFLRYFADLDYRSIAAALDIEVGSVSATLAAAHAALRRSALEVER